MDLDGKRVVVTGGSKGIGAELARQFTGAGASVAVVARPSPELASISEQLGAIAIEADLATPDGTDGLVERCIEQLGHVDVWVNNAGVETNESFVGTDRADVRRLLRINLEAPMLLTHDVVRHMLGRGSGHVVQISSAAGAVPFPGLTAYAGSKAGLTHFTESLRLELKGTGVGVTVVAPGFVDTAMLDRLMVDDSFQEPALARFRHLRFAPVMTPDLIASKTVAAVADGKPHVRLPKRYGVYHLLNNAPRRLVQASLIGVRLPLPPTTGT